MNSGWVISSLSYSMRDRTLMIVHSYDRFSHIAEVNIRPASFRVNSYHVMLDWRCFTYLLGSQSNGITSLFIKVQVMNRLQRTELYFHVGSQCFASSVHVGKFGLVPSRGSSTLYSLVAMVLRCVQDPSVCQCTIPGSGCSPFSLSLLVEINQEIQLWVLAIMELV